MLNWEPRPDPAAYAHLLRAASRAIKRVDRHAFVVTAGMPFLDRQLETSFLSKMFRAGARGTFDALAIHPYAGSVAGAIHKLQVARDVMGRFGAGRKPLWVTEVAWAGGGARAYVANQRGQAQNLVDSSIECTRTERCGWKRSSGMGGKTKSMVQTRAIGATTSACSPPGCGRS